MRSEVGIFYHVLQVSCKGLQSEAGLARQNKRENLNKTSREKKSETPRKHVCGLAGEMVHVSVGTFGDEAL